MENYVIFQKYHKNDILNDSYRNYHKEETFVFLKSKKNSFIMFNDLLLEKEGKFSRLRNIYKNRAMDKLELDSILFNGCPHYEYINDLTSGVHNFPLLFLDKKNYLILDPFYY
jgi:hypothetical protein